MNSHKEYIGDSVYVEIDDFGDVVLTTHNGYDDDPRNRIVLEPTVLKSLLYWFSGQGWKLEEQEMSELVTPTGKVMPTIGRMMHYLTQEDTQDGEVLTFPAVVTAVHSPNEEDKQNVNLTVFGQPGIAAENAREIRLVQPGDPDGPPLPHCRWLPRD